jgi:hypothetical protein
MYAISLWLNSIFGLNTVFELVVMKILKNFSTNAACHKYALIREFFNVCDLQSFS